MHLWCVYRKFTNIKIYPRFTLFEKDKKITGFMRAVMCSEWKSAITSEDVLVLLMSHTVNDTCNWSLTYHWLHHRKSPCFFFFFVLLCHLPAHTLTTQAAAIYSCLTFVSQIENYCSPDRISGLLNSVPLRQIQNLGRLPSMTCS